MTGNRFLSACAVALLALPAASCTRGSEREDASPRQAPSIATLTEAVSEVQLRRASELIWNPVAAGAALANRDSVRTGPRSSGRVVFVDGTELKISESSLVLIVDRAAGQESVSNVVSLPSGTLQAELGKPKEKDVELIVRTRSGWIRASNRGRGGPSRFNVSVDKQGNVQVRADQGPVQYEAQGMTRTLRESEDLAVKGPSASASVDVTSEEVPDTLPVVSADRIRARDDGAGFELLSPKHEQLIEGDKVLVRGRMGRSIQAFVNGERLRAGAGGRFSLELPLTPGVNALTFQIIGPRKDEVRYETLEVTRK